MRGLLKLVTGQKVDDVAALAAEIDAEKRKAADACTEIERIEVEQRNADSYDKARELDEAIARARWQVEHADAVLPDLERRLSAAKAEQLAAGIARHESILRKRYPQFRAALQAAVDQQAAVIREREEAFAELGEGVAARLPLITYAGFLYKDLLAIWTAENDRVFADPPAKPVIAAPRPAPAKPAEPEFGFGWTRRRNPPTAPPEPAPRPKRQPRRDAEAGPGKRLVTILRNTVDIDGVQAANGDVLAVAVATAEALVRGGAADFADEGDTK